MPRILPALPTVFALLLWTSCGGPPATRQSRPLFSSAQKPDILTESLEVCFPPSTDGNRFLSGWDRRGRRESMRLVPREDGARLELVRLVADARTLELDIELPDAAPRGPVAVEIDGQPAGEVTLSSPLKIPLPSDLPLGRYPLTLRFPPQPQVAVRGAQLNAAATAGEVLLSEHEVRQSGYSLLDSTLRVPGDTILKGVFQPPPERAPGQVFTLLVERDGEDPRVAFAWPPPWWRLLSRDPELSVPLGSEPGLVRVRLLARGEGPAAVWQGLHLDLPEAVGSPVSKPAAVPEAPPMVILYVLDALRADALEAVDADGRTAVPHLGRVVREGVSFVRHQSVAPNTLPSTKALFSGRTNRLKGAFELTDKKFDTLAEAFAEAGYRTASFSGNSHVCEATGLTRGFQHVEERAFFDVDETSEKPYNDSAERVHSEALQWLDGLGTGEKAFLYLHTIHPHGPYDPPDIIGERFTRGVDSEISGDTATLRAIQRLQHQVVAADRKRLRGLYLGGLAYNDAEIGRFVEALRERYSSRDLLLIFTSDHGEELFDHGGVLHGYTLYREQIEIPLILWWPGSLEPQRVEASTTTLDLHESLRALISLPSRPGSEGRSFWSLLDGGTQKTADELRFAAASSVKGGVFLAQSSRYKLILAPRIGRQWGMGEGLGRTRDAEYVFDLASDPLERLNRAGDRSLEIAWLRSRLLAWIDQGRQWEEEQDQPLELDLESRRRLQALGYLGGPDG